MAREAVRVTRAVVVSLVILVAVALGTLAAAVSSLARRPVECMCEVRP